MALSEILNISFELSNKIGTRELPHLSEHYESNIPGLYIVGDLADAPVIKIALNQGYDIVSKMADRDFGAKAPPAQPGVLDVAIIGAGPSGIGAALACRARGLAYEIIERERPFNTIQNYPKHKHVFAEPKDFGANRFPFMDSIKEDLVRSWEKAIEENQLVIRQPEEVTDIKRNGDLFEIYSSRPDAGKNAPPRVVLARRVVLAIGRRGTVNKIGCKGEDSPKVAYGLADPDKHKGERTLVVGGGDSAVEAAIALAQAGAESSISYRQETFSRVKALNKERIEELIAQGRVKAYFKSSVKEITPGEVIMKGPDGGDVVLPNDRVFALIGTKLPIPFLQKIGIRMEGAFSWQRAAFVSAFALITYLFYVIKTHRDFWPFGPGHLLGGVPKALETSLGFRAVDGGFWGTVIYSLMITGFGIQAIRRYRSPIQTKRYISLIVFQLVFLFAIPEVIGPLFIERPWKLYAISVPWPLSIWSVIDYESTAWIVAGALVAFAGVPLFVRYHGERFCSWACGCGGLAETLGDRWRHLAPRGTTSKKAEVFGLVVLGAAAVTTLSILAVDIWKLADYRTWGDTKMFLQSWYGLVVDFWFASVVGVAFYPYLGNRVWCRFMCPLRAYMELLSKWFSKIKIVANEKCIGCSECTRYCQMGIPVQKFAQLRTDLSNVNSACIQCGICVEVCPMNVLTVVRGETSNRNAAKNARRSLNVVS